MEISFNRTYPLGEWKGLHRYITVVYKHPAGMIQFDEPQLNELNGWDQSPLSYKRNDFTSTLLFVGNRRKETLFLDEELYRQVRTGGSTVGRKLFSSSTLVKLSETERISTRPALHGAFVVRHLLYTGTHTSLPVGGSRSLVNHHWFKGEIPIVCSLINDLDDLKG